MCVTLQKETVSRGTPLSRYKLAVTNGKTTDAVSGKAIYYCVHCGKGNVRDETVRLPRALKCAKCGEPFPVDMHRSKRFATAHIFLGLAFIGGGIAGALLTSFYFAGVIFVGLLWIVFALIIIGRETTWKMYTWLLCGAPPVEV